MANVSIGINHYATIVRDDVEKGKHNHKMAASEAIEMCQLEYNSNKCLCLLLAVPLYCTPLSYINIYH